MNPITQTQWKIAFNRLQAWATTGLPMGLKPMAEGYARRVVETAPTEHWRDVAMGWVRRAGL